jgi:hypothetical protein
METVRPLQCERINSTMKKLFFLGLTFLLSITTVFSQDVTQERTAQDRTADRAELQKLLMERQKKFDAYSASLKKRSGFFGGKSKQDIQRSNEVLRDIIESDNKIMSVLNRVVDFKVYEKVNMNYDLLSCNERVSNLQGAVEILNNRISKMTLSNVMLEKQTGNLKLLASVFGILILVLLVLITRKKFTGGA